MLRQFRLSEIDISRDTLGYHWDAGGASHVVTLCYHGCDFTSLPPPVARSCLFHIAAFDALKLLSLEPDILDFGPLREFVSEDFLAVWTTICHHVSGEWRYRHRQPRLKMPAVEVARAGPAPVEPAPTGDGVLLLFGGGKDSAVSATLLETARVSYSTLAYSRDVYGPGDAQHRLLDTLLDEFHPQQRHSVTVHDTFVHEDAFDGETPWSVFAALPRMLTSGPRHLVVGNEKSADVGNLVWNGEEINHQWGKGFEAELLLDSYLGRLAPGRRYWSILKPVRDTVIFQLLDPAVVAKTHSCNVAKPWCGVCPKCAYVKLGFRAYVQGQADAARTVHDPANLPHYRQMLGLEEHTPFECIGETDEVKLMFALLDRQGEPIARELAEAARAGLTPQVAARMAAVDGTRHGIPPGIWPSLSVQLEDGAARALVRTGEIFL